MKRLLGPRLPIEFAERADADITATRLLGPVPVFLWDRSRCNHVGLLTGYGEVFWQAS